MTPITTKHNLMAALFNGTSLYDNTGRLIFSSVLAIEKEDGSGSNWNVKGYGTREPGAYTIFVQTVD